MKIIVLSAMKRKFPVPLVAALAVVGAPGGLASLAQESPPANLTRAQISSCGVYNPSHCQSITAWVEPAWCGRRTRAWKPNEGNLVISVSCRR